ncbi:MAG TPA: ribonuclease HII [Dehalococcoidia bacterium]|nr:ribonuclease HII [Dehalococcoidia bacterium]
MAAGPAPLPSTAFEEPLWAERRLVAGVDEVGRGPIAGPVYAAAVILHQTARPGWLCDLRDSKTLTAPERERLSQAVREEAPAYGIGWATVAEIDAWGISAANRLAMVRALRALPLTPDFVLIDGPAKLPGLSLPQQAIVDGDALCMSIAAASIVAKVARDEVMRRLDGLFPAYGFASHKGYATKEHLERLALHGPCVQHRRSWPAVQRRALGDILAEAELYAAR